MDNVCFSGAALATVTALLTALVGAIGILFRALLASKDAQHEDCSRERQALQERLDRAMGLSEEGQRIAREIVARTPRQPRR